ncbi:uncharacterized protein LOC110028932 [Phalaenopsis equestris]|uniref:uncharacterized protein LOC110028932 n=1 Tax=Phalaenopsis equestris TaxID=78828 RepID=UPI0009E55825|nr:uncharacterized protein LOC110028932 [Phalaenopsis equestris]
MKNPPKYPYKQRNTTVNHSLHNVISLKSIPQLRQFSHFLLHSLASYFPQIRHQYRETMDAGYGGRFEAQRLLEIADKYLLASDLTGSKRFAERALESDPLLDGVDQILAVVDVLLASQRRVNNQHDWYSILQLPHPSSSVSGSGDNRLDIKRSYRHLTFLLSPNRNKYPYADTALRIVFDAYTFLSDPTKASVYESQLRSNSAPATVAQPADRLFWTSCPSCCHVFEYDRVYIKRTLRCRICMRPFHAVEMAAAPTIVPGTDMYYCAWGFFPLGFPGCGFSNCNAAGVPPFGEGWKPFFPVSPRWGNEKEGHKEKPLNAVPVNAVVGHPNADAENSRRMGSFVRPKKRGLPMRNKKMVAKKRVGNYERKIDLFGETDSEVEEQETGGATGGTVAPASEGEGIANFDIDLEATEDLLSNLHDLPFV